MRSLARSSAAMLAICAVAMAAGAQAQKQAAKKVAAKRANELTLAGLRPGRDRVGKASQMFRKFKVTGESELKAGQILWSDACRHQTLQVDLDTDNKVRVIRATLPERMMADCSKQSLGPWKTGRGLRVGDSTSRVLKLYGDPDSRSPSTKDGQPLELWYYAFDWAGADVPQLMEVLCTREAEGKPRWVVEITLAGPSL